MILGQNGNITYEEAMNNRISKEDDKFIGRGILSWKEGKFSKRNCFLALFVCFIASHLNIHHNTIRGVPNAGIRLDQADYITIHDNTIVDNTYWGSTGDSGVVIARSISLDEKDM